MVMTYFDFTEFWSAIWTKWHFHPDVLIGLAVILGLYLWVIGPGRIKLGLSEIPVNQKQILMFVTSILIILFSLISPLHELSDNFLFSAHMLQHVLLTLIVPPLMIAGIPGWAFKPVMKIKFIAFIAKLLTHPVITFSGFNLVFSFWHFPALYATSVDFHSFHVLEHLMFISTAVMMWWPLMSSSKELPPISEPAKMLYLLGLAIAQILVFAPITFSDAPLYEFYVNAPAVWNLSNLADQQIGGLIMKVGGGVLFMFLFIRIFLRWAKNERSDTKSFKKQQIEINSVKNKTSSSFISSVNS
jgi:putative membrane protein